MGSPLIKRLDALYQRAQMVMAVQADHAPFVSIAPWSFIKDECIVKYYPEGHYQKPEQITTTLHDAFMIAQYYYELRITRTEAFVLMFQYPGFGFLRQGSIQRNSGSRWEND